MHARQTAPYLIHTRSACPFRDLAVDLDDPRIVASFGRYNAAPQFEYVMHYTRRARIEPIHGYAVTGWRELIPESVPHYWQIGYPPITSAPGVRLRREAVQPAVISLREGGETNYYHFYSDVLGKLALLERWPWTRDLPIVISRALHDQPYFQAVLARSSLGRRRWIVQDRNAVVADEAVFCKPLPHQRATFDWVIDQIHAAPADPHADRRILLTRSPARGRFIENGRAVEQVARSYGFEVVDADQLQLDDQMALFAAARYVIGVHGAGLVNLMFRRGAPLSLLELFPPDNIPPHYFWLCHNFGFGYGALVGSPGTIDRAFVVDSARLHTAIERLLLHDGSPAEPLAARQPAALR